jgi:holin-like protein
MIQGVGLLLGFQLVGEVSVRLLHVPIPGSIVGLLLLFASLQARTMMGLCSPETIDTAEVAQVATPLLRNLAILFVAPGVGVMQYLDLFWQNGPAVLLVLVGSTLATMAATALAFVAAQSIAAWLRVARSQVRRADEGSASAVPAAVESPVVPVDHRDR